MFETADGLPLMFLREFWGRRPEAIAAENGEVTLLGTPVLRSVFFKALGPLFHWLCGVCHTYWEPTTRCEERGGTPGAGS